ncbi:hypothetical protein BDR06DRAFT_755672 [Suillus hirtellus]|nr:hypothetical protein BDR06DRAFT_755672 [Suillus hirtellus]
MPRATPSQAQQASPQDTQTPSISTMQTSWNTSQTRRPLPVSLIHAHSATSTVVLNGLASETWIDIAHVEKAVETHWISEFGILNVFLLPGPVPTDIFT